MASKTSKRTTVADLIAAAELGAIDLTAVVVTAEAAESQVAAATAEATAARAAVADYTERDMIGSLPANDHACGIVGCRHGAAHGPAQPDRQLKLATECGAVARMTARALAAAGGSITDSHGHAFAVAARRTYSRKAA